MAPRPRHPLWRQWIIVKPLAETPSVIHALSSVGKTTTIGVVVFLIDITTYNPLSEKFV